MEVMVADIHTVDLQALSMLPCMSNLEITKPRLAVECTFLLLVVKAINFLPASVPAVLSLDAFVRQVVEI